MAGLVVQIGTYNTNLQAGAGLPQDLIDWIAPTFQVAQFLAQQKKNDVVVPDICVIAFQELLELHKGLAGYADSVIDSRDTHIRAEIERHTPDKESYSLVSKIVNVGVALLVYVRDASLASRVCDVETAWTGCGPLWMGNKGAVSVRFRIKDIDGGPGEIFTFVGAHLTAHAPKLQRRIEDYKHVVGTLVFNGQKTIYDTSHLFFTGDLNFRVVLPSNHELAAALKGPSSSVTLSNDENRRILKEFDQLLIEKRKGSVFQGLKEGDFWKFKCSYKYQLGEVDQYSAKRTPAWTDRVLYASYLDDVDSEQSAIRNLLYTSIPSYTTSDHKPVVSVLLLPESPSSNSTVPKLLKLPASFTPVIDRHGTLKKYTGRVVDRIVGLTWWLLIIIGMGNSAVGIFNFVVGASAWRWWARASSTSTSFA